jgi:RNA polymerase sigma-70 factor (ECF subfamily)
VRNIAFDYLKKKKRLAELDLDDFQEYLQEPLPNPEENFLEKEGHQKILEALGKIHKSYADVLALHVFFELGDKEIAKLLNITPENVRVQLHRGRKQLLKFLKGDG